MIIKPAKRTESVNEYYFSKKLREIAEMNAAGERVINLGVGSPDRPPHESVIRALSECASSPYAHGYQSYQGLPELRHALADWYLRYYGVKLNPDSEMQLLAGSKEGILVLSLAFLDEGDEVLVPNPGYPTYSSASALAGGVIVPYDLKEELGWQPDFEALERMDLSRVKMMWTNYPNMPTGGRATKELFERLVDFGLRHNILICNDSAYSFILTKERLSILSIPHAKSCCVEFNSLSKALNMAGWRIGVISGDAEVIKTFLKVKSNQDSGMFKAVQMAAVEALKRGEDWYRQINEIYARRKVVAAKIFDLLGASYDMETEGLFLWGRVGGAFPNGEALSEYILHEAKVFIAPGFIFGSNGDQYIRISLCATEETLRESYNRIAKALKQK